MMHSEALALSRLRVVVMLLCLAASAPAAAQPRAAASAPAASEAKPYVSVLKPYAEDVGAVLSVGSALVLMLAFGFAAVLVHREWRRDPLIIEPFDVPKDLQDVGLNGTVLSQQLFDAILELQRQARPDDGHADNSFVELPRLQVDLQLPGVSWSVRSAIRYFKHALGRSERRLVGEAYKTGSGDGGDGLYAMRVRSSEGRAADVPVRFLDGEGLAACMRSAAAAALPLTNPLEAASIFFSIENPATGYPRTLAAIGLHLRAGPIPTHQDAYVLWASVLRNCGDLAGMRAKLALAAGADVSLRSGTETGRLMPRYLNFTGGLYREERQFDLAERAFEEALRREPRNIAALNNLGLLKFDAEDLDGARGYFQKVIRQSPQSSRGYRGLGLVAHRDGDLRTALRYLSRAVDLAPLARWPRVNLIEVLTRIGDLRAAEAAADELMRLDAAFAPQYRYRSRLALERSDLAGAWRWAEKACTTDPNDAWCYVDRSRVALAMGRFEEAARDAVETMRLRPTIPEGYRCLAQARVQQNRPAEAFALLERAITIAPADIWAWLDKAALQRRIGDDAAAADTFEAIARIRPASADVWRRWAALDAAHGRFDAAETKLRINTRARPHDFWSWLELAELLRRQQRFAEALAAAREAQALPNLPARALQKMALVMKDQQRMSEAEDLLRQAVQAQPGDGYALADLVDLLLQQERLQEAAVLCAQGVARGSQQALLRRRWAAVLRELGDASGERAQLAAAIAEAPFDAQLRIDMADHGLRRHLPEALDFAEQAVRLAPTQPGCLSVLARARADRGDLDGAAAALASASALEPSAEWLMMQRCHALARWGRHAEGKAVAAGFLQRRPESVRARIQLVHAQLALGDTTAARAEAELVAESAAQGDTAKRLAHAAMLLDIGEPAACLAAAEHAWQHDGTSLAALRLMAGAEAVRGNSTAAIALRERAAALAPGEVEDLLRMADLLEDAQQSSAQQPGAADQALAEAIRRRPPSLLVRREKLQHLLRRKDWDAARAEVQALCQLAPATADDLLTWFDALRGAPDPALRAEAWTALKQAEARQPAANEVALRLAAWHLAENNQAAALAVAEAALPKLPANDADALLELADKFGKLGRDADAVALARRAAALRPFQPWIQSRAATAYLQARQWQAGIDLLRAALALRPDYDWDEARLANALYETGDIAGATQLSAKVLARNPDDWTAKQLDKKLKKLGTQPAPPSPSTP